MKILFVSSYLPYPLFSGGHIRLFNILKELSKKHKITLVCEARNYQVKGDVREVNKFCEKVITVPRKKQWTLENILKTGISFYPFLMVGHTSKELRNKIEEQLEGDKFNVIHVETFYVMQNLPSTNIPVVLGEQNTEYFVYKRFVNYANPLVRALLLFDVAKIKYWEEQFWKKAAGVVVTSKREEELVKKYNNNVAIVPNGVDLQKFKRLEVKSQRSEVKTILFIGDFRWIENRDATGWLLKEIWPELKLKVESGKLKVKLWVVGKNIPDSIKNLTSDKDVVFDENAPADTPEIFGKADLLLAPIRVGGGGKFKILESMASGVPVVTTRVGIEGIDGQDNKEVLIADQTEELVDKTLKALTNESLYKNLQKNARLLIEKKYSWKLIVKELEKAYDSTINYYD